MQLCPFLQPITNIPNPLPSGLVIPSPTFPGVPDFTTADYAKGVPFILGTSGGALTAPADTNENVLATITVPANAIGANGSLRITTLWSVTNNANVKTPRIRFSGAAGTIFRNVAMANQVTWYDQFSIINANATNSQFGSVASTQNGPFALSGSARATGAIDTTAATTIVISAQKATAGDTMSLDYYLVELIRR